MMINTVQIHLIRPGKPERVLSEYLLEKDQSKLRTYNIVPPERRASLSALFSTSEAMQLPQQIHSVGKTYYFHEYFDILELLGPNGNILGYYTDIAAPMQIIEDRYYLKDWFLDLRLSPEGDYEILDQDEFSEAVRMGLLSEQEAQTAQLTLARLITETKQGKFPFDYLSS